MIEIFLFFILICAVVLLVTLSIIDLRIGLLPNVHNGALAALGIAFHVLSGFAYLSPVQMLVGAIVGGGFLLGIRFVANRYYGEDALGLGDVKLLAAAGLWLGTEHVLAALVIGALAGLLHGGLVIGIAKLKKQETGSLSRFSIPAGPGFCVGIFLVGLAKFQPFIQTVFL